MSSDSSNLEETHLDPILPEEQKSEVVHNNFKKEENEESEIIGLQDKDKELEGRIEESIPQNTINNRNNISIEQKQEEQEEIIIVVQDEDDDSSTQNNHQNCSTKKNNYPTNSLLHKRKCGHKEEKEKYLLQQNDQLREIVKKKDQEIDELKMALQKKFDEYQKQREEKENLQKKEDGDKLKLAIEDRNKKSEIDSQKYSEIIKQNYQDMKIENRILMTITSHKYGQLNQNYQAQNIQQIGQQQYGSYQQPYQQEKQYNQRPQQSGYQMNYQQPQQAGQQQNYQQPQQSREQNNYQQPQQFGQLQQNQQSDKQEQQQNYQQPQQSGQQQQNYQQPQQSGYQQQNQNYPQQSGQWQYYQCPQQQAQQQYYQQPQQSGQQQQNYEQPCQAGQWQNYQQQEQAGQQQNYQQQQQSGQWQNYQQPQQPEQLFQQSQQNQFQYYQQQPFQYQQYGNNYSFQQLNQGQEYQQQQQQQSQEYQQAFQYQPYQQQNFVVNNTISDKIPDFSLLIQEKYPLDNVPFFQNPVAIEKILNQQNSKDEKKRAELEWHFNSKKIFGGSLIRDDGKCFFRSFFISYLLAKMIEFQSNANFSQDIQSFLSFILQIKIYIPDWIKTVFGKEVDINSLVQYSLQYFKSIIGEFTQQSAVDDLFKYQNDPIFDLALQILSRSMIIKAVEEIKENNFFDLFESIDVEEIRKSVLGYNIENDLSQIYDCLATFLQAQIIILNCSNENQTQFEVYEPLYVIPESILKLKETTNNKDSKIGQLSLWLYTKHFSILFTKDLAEKLNLIPQNARY